MSNQKKPKVFKFICRCNGIAKDEVIEAIKKGSRTVDQVGDQTTAGFGGCGGSCRPDIKKLINETISKKV